MTVSSFLVVSNSLRLFFFKPGFKKRKKYEKYDEKYEKKESIEKMKEERAVITVKGMMCPHCSGRVKAALEKLNGVFAEVSHESGEAVVTFAAPITLSQLEAIIEAEGYEVVRG